MTEGREPDRGAELELFVDDVGVVAFGSEAALSLLAADFDNAVGGAGDRFPGDALPAIGAVAASAAAFAGTHRQLFEFSARTVAQLRSSQLLPTENGYFWSALRGKTGFIGNVQWKPVNCSPEQLLSLQTAVVGLALQAAIREVAKAVERVEGKVDELVRAMRAERIGRAIGDLRILTSVTESSRENEALSATDWSSVAGLGPQTLEAIDATRAHIKFALNGGGWRMPRTPRSRAEQLEKLLSDAHLNELLALLTVLERNLILWHGLRLANIQQREPEHLRGAVGMARHMLLSQREADQALIAQLQDVSSGLTDPRFFDGLDPIHRGELNEAREKLDEMLATFAADRVLDRDDLLPALYPRFADSVLHGVDRTGRALKTGAGRVGAAGRELWSRAQERREKP